MQNVLPVERSFIADIPSGAMPVLTHENNLLSAAIAASATQNVMTCLDTFLKFTANISHANALS